jgi:predicted dehydrogenase
MRTRRITINLMQQLRFGILSTANIGRQNWKAICNSGNAVVTAVASRDAGRSREFIRKLQAEFPFAAEPAALGSYEELLASPDVDAVYIPLPTGLRQEWVLRAAAAGKHVVCEKPCGVSVADVREMTDACRKHRVQFMDGVMFMHNPRLPRVRGFLEDNKSVGPLRRIASAFSFLGTGGFSDSNIRVDGQLEPTGCLGDLGWYCIRFTLWALKWQLPHTVMGRILSQSGSAGGRVSAPTDFSAELFFDGGVSATFYCSFLAAPQQWVFVSGRDGWLRVADFVHPFNGYEPAFEVNRTEIRVATGASAPTPASDPADLGHATAQNTLMFRNFAHQVFSGKLNDEWPMWALQTQQVMDACFKSAKNSSIGVAP